MIVKSSLYHLGLSCFPISIMALINIFYSFYFEYLENINSYLSTLILSLISGLLLYYLGKKKSQGISIYEQLILIFFIYLLIPFFY